MTRSHNPDPDDPNALSPWEHQVLAGIEHDLAASDPGLADTLNAPSDGRAQRWWPISRRSTCALVVGLAVVAVVGALLPASAWAVLGVVTTMIIVPWLLFAATEKRYPH